MFSRKNKAERTAAQAWDYLSSAMAAAGESAREAGRHTADVAGSTAADLSDRAGSLSGRAGRTGSKLADKAGRKRSSLVGKASKKSGKVSRKSAKLADRASRKAGSAGTEAWVRANAAANALAGRKPGAPWGLIAGFSLIGVAIGWAAATTARSALERQAENEQLELAETAVIVTPTTFDH
jgi:hypothetical protein